MKNILVILCAALALAACSSAPKSTNFDFANGCSVVLPSDWDVVPGDDTMPNTVMALAPVDNGFRSQMRIDALRPFDMEKGETALKLKESLEGKSSLLEPPALVKISGEPSPGRAKRIPPRTLFLPSTSRTTVTSSAPTTTSIPWTSPASPARLTK